MAVGWFHAEAHRIVCCLNWSGLYLEGAGRSIGEQTEQLWAYFKLWARIVCYMSKPNWFDTVEYRLAKVVETKAAGFVRLLAAAWKNMGAKTDAARKRLAEALTEAGTRGLSKADLVNLVEALKRRSTRQQGGAGTKMEQRERNMMSWIEAKMELEALENAGTVFFPGKAGKELRLRSQDKSKRESARRRVAMTQARLRLGELPQPTDPQYKSTFTALVVERANECKQRAEEVAKVQFLTKARSREGASGVGSKSMQNKLASARAKLANALQELQYWTRVRHSDGTDVAIPGRLLAGLPAQWTNELLDDLLAGKLTVGSSTQEAHSAAAKLELAVKYAAAKAEVTRGTEARAIINAECFRVLKFYERMADHCETAAKRDDQEAVRAIQAARGAVGDAADVVLTPQQLSELNVPRRCARGPCAAGGAAALVTPHAA